MESVRFGSRSEVGRALGGELVAGGGGGARWGAKRHLQELKEIQRGLKVVRACEIEPVQHRYRLDFSLKTCSDRPGATN